MAIVRPDQSSGGGGGGGVSSVFGRTGAVAAANGDYGGVVAAFLTGATQASRYVGATTSGAPVSGTFAVGDFVVARNGHIFVCTAAGTPGTWVDVGSVSNLVTSVFGRTGAVVAASGDYSLNQIGAATGDYSLNSHKITNLADGVAAQDAATVNQLPGGGNLNMGGHKVTSVANGTAATDAAAFGQVVGALLFASVLGADTNSIDTGANGIAGGYNVLEVWLIARTDESAGAKVTLTVRVNGDSGSNYDLQRVNGVSTTAGATIINGGTSWPLTVHGGGGAANFASMARMSIPGYAGTTFYKTGELLNSVNDSTSTNGILSSGAFTWRSTSAINQLSIAADVGAKLKAGSALYIYGR